MNFLKKLGLKKEGRERGTEMKFKQNQKPKGNFLVLKKRGGENTWGAFCPPIGNSPTGGGPKEVKAHPKTPLFYPKEIGVIDRFGKGKTFLISRSVFFLMPYWPILALGCDFLT